VRQRRGADHAHRAVAPEQVEERVEIVRRGDRVQDEVEPVRLLPHLVGVLRDDYLMGSQPLRVGGLARRSREHHHVRAEGVGQLDRHVPESPKADHANRAPFPDFPVAERGVRRDARAQKRGYRGEIEVRRNPQDEPLVDDDAARVAAVGHPANVPVGAVVGEDDLVAAVLFQPFHAVGTFPARVDHAADSGQIAPPESLHPGAHLGHPPDDLVAWHDGVGRSLPLVPRGVQVGVADSTMEDLDPDVVLPRFPALETEGVQWRSRALPGISNRFDHVPSPFFLQMIQGRCSAGGIRFTPPEGLRFKS